MVSRVQAGLAALLLLSAASLAVTPPCYAKTPPLDYHEPKPDPPDSGKILRDQPGQTASPPIPAPLVRPGPFQQLPAIDESHIVPLPVSKQPYWTFGQIDPVLTEACRLNDFITLPINRIVLQFAGSEGRALMQVVPPLYRHLLYDRRNLARPGEIYYFYDTARPDCEVRVDKNVKLRSFPPGRTTALPPTDPKAVAKREKLIKSWPNS